MKDNEGSVSFFEGFMKIDFWGDKQPKELGFSLQWSFSLILRERRKRRRNYEENEARRNYEENEALEET